VREHVREKYIEPARRRGDALVRVPVGEVHRALRLTNLVPLVCNALKSKIFLRENCLVLVEVEGPPSGLSTTVVYTYKLQSVSKGREEPNHPFWNLRGVAADLFRGYGGGEAFLRDERTGFFGAAHGKGAIS
jgi:hypothetical protein